MNGLSYFCAAKSCPQQGKSPHHLAEPDVSDPVFFVDFAVGSFGLSWVKTWCKEIEMV